MLVRLDCKFSILFRVDISLISTIRNVWDKFRGMNKYKYVIEQGAGNQNVCMCLDAKRPHKWPCHGDL